MSNLMTNYNERLDGILDTLLDDYSKNRAKQAINSLNKELVAEAKPVEYVSYDATDPLKRGRQIGYDEAVRKFEQNLLKGLEEV